MKRVIDGVTYNTDTSTIVATIEWTEEATWGAPEIDHLDFLYRTRGGAFFSVEKRTFAQKNREGEWDRVEKVEFFALNFEKAQAWILQNGVEIIDATVFGEPPEASAEPDKGATLYLRLPTSLKVRIDKAAQENDISANAWAMRCLERCLAG